MFNEILGIHPAWCVFGRDTDEHDRRFRIVPPVEDTRCPYESCSDRNQPQDKQKGVRRRRGMEREKYFADVPMQGYRIVLQVLRLQFKCRACRRIFIQAVPGVDTKRRMTIRLIEYINREVPKRTFAAVADEVGLNEKTVRNVFREHIQAMNDRAAPAPATDKDRRNGQWILGIDEVFYRNDYERSKAANKAKQRLEPGQKKRRAKKPSQHHSGQFLTVLIDMNRRVVVDILRHRHPYQVSAELRKLPGADQVKVVCMDMAKQTFYLAAKEALPHAAIVIDKFHVIEKANTILKPVRAAHRAEARFVEKREGRLNAFEKLRLATFESTCPELYDAYKSKELLYSIYDRDNRREALRAYGAWCRFTRASKVKKKFEVLIKMLKEWRPSIFAYFDHPPITNALTETTNGIIS